MTAPTTKTDAITGWWRGVSLRAKVTGVTVAVLAIGLFATGIGAWCSCARHWSPA